MRARWPTLVAVVGLLVFAVLQQAPVPAPVPWTPSSLPRDAVRRGIEARRAASVPLGCPEHTLVLCGPWFGRHGNQVWTVGTLMAIARALNRTALLRPFHQTLEKQFHTHDPSQSSVRFGHLYDTAAIGKPGAPLADYCVAETEEMAVDMKPTHAVDDAFLRAIRFLPPNGGDNMTGFQSPVIALNAQEVFFLHLRLFPDYDETPGGPEKFFSFSAAISNITAKTLAALGIDSTKPTVAVHHRWHEGHCRRWLWSLFQQQHDFDPRICAIQPDFAMYMLQSQFPRQFPSRNLTAIAAVQFVLSSDGQHADSLAAWQRFGIKHNNNVFVLTERTLRALPAQAHLHPLEAIASSMEILVNSSYFIPNAVSTMSRVPRSMRLARRLPTLRPVTQWEGLKMDFGEAVSRFL